MSPRMSLAAAGLCACYVVRNLLGPRVDVFLSYAGILGYGALSHS